MSLSKRSFNDKSQNLYILEFKYAFVQKLIELPYPIEQDLKKSMTASHMGQSSLLGQQNNLGQLDYMG